MRIPRTSQFWLLAALLVCSAHFGVQRITAQDEKPAPDKAAAADDADAKDENAAEGVEVLTRGPVHEAFAGTITFAPEPSVVITKGPPEAIEELPPEQTIEGENVAWIPGYWGWDDEREDFLWVSGVWRSLPPGRQWLPGYWVEVDGGHQWIAGYWSDTKVEEVTYLPDAPPETAEAGPNVDPPSANHVWVPGTWVWQETRYLWQAGYWVIAKPNWVWIPSYYVWAPRGYVFIDGYWDYSIARRGLLFAPVYLTSSVYTRQGFVYSPVVVINTTIIVNQLFVRPQYSHYYYGDYYAPNYASSGFYAWFQFNNRFGYDPFYVYHRWEHRGDRIWDRQLQADFKQRVDNEDARPPRTFADQQKLAKSEKNNNLIVTASLSELSKAEKSPVKLRQIDKAERQKIAKQGQQVQQFRAERQKLEAAQGSDPKSADKPEQATVKLPKSPITAQAGGEASKELTPPQAPAIPKVDPKAQPSAKTSRGQAKPGDDDPDAPRTKPGTTPKTRPGTTPGTKPGTKPGRTPSADPDSEPGSDPKPGSKPKTETKPLPKPKVEPKPEPKPMPKVEPKAEPKPMPKVEPKAEPKPMPKVEPKPMPKPKVEPKAEPAPVPKPKKKPEEELEEKPVPPAPKTP